MASKSKKTARPLMMPIAFEPSYRPEFPGMMFVTMMCDSATAEGFARHLNRPLDLTVDATDLAGKSKDHPLLATQAKPARKAPAKPKPAPKPKPAA